MCIFLLPRTVIRLPPLTYMHSHDAVPACFGNFDISDGCIFAGCLSTSPRAITCQVVCRLPIILINSSRAPALGFDDMANQEISCIGLGFHMSGT
jgi:hypothetical protein